ncbi:ead/Ea22-like family protein [Enterobacter hormaechei]
MSNIDKRALRKAAEQAGADEWCAFIDTKSKTYSVHTPGDNRCGDVVKWAGFDGQQRAAAKAKFIAAANPATVLALLDELEAADALNKHLELAIRRAEGCSEALRRKLEAAEERIAELSELPMKSDVEKKPQNTLSGRPVYLGDGSDAKETLIAGKRDIHRYGSLITDKAWKGD